MRSIFPNSAHSSWKAWVGVCREVEGRGSGVLTWGSWSPFQVSMFRFVSPRELQGSSKATADLDGTHWQSHRGWGMPHGIFARCHSMASTGTHRQGLGCRVHISHPLTHTQSLNTFPLSWLGQTPKFLLKKMNFACRFGDMIHSTILGGER